MSTTVKLYVPGIGEPLKLVEPWTFRLYHEGRNKKLLERLFGKREVQWYGNLASDTVTLPAGITLACRRVYIRQNLPDYHSITFSITGWPDKDSKKLYGKSRFWAKLFDVNQMVVDVPDEVRHAGLVRHAERQMFGHGR